MELKRLPGTCSMLELHNLHGPSGVDLLSKRYLYNMIQEYESRHKKENNYGVPKALIMNLNTRMGFFARRKFKKKTGFKRIAVYEGGMRHVETYFLDISKLNF